MGKRSFSMPDELYFLCILHNVGATSPDKSLTFEEIKNWTTMEPEKVSKYIERLIETNNVQADFNTGVQRYYLTIDGIRKVLSMYS